MSILAINIGNSRTAVGWFAGDQIQRSARIDKVTPVILEGVANDEKPDRVGICSVVPNQNRAWERLVKKVFPKVPIHWVTHESELGLPLDLKRPDQTGCDRIADAVAGAELCGKPCIVCDFGTASTFNLVLPRKGFAGGVIAPGYGMWFEAMHRGAAQLPDLKPGGVKVKTGRNTEEAIRLSARWGYRGMVTEIIWQLSQSCGKKDPGLCATGGWAQQIMSDCGLEIPLIPDLTLFGIAKIAERA